MKFIDMAGIACGRAGSCPGETEMRPLEEQRGWFPRLSVPPPPEGSCRASSSPPPCLEIGCKHEGSTAEREGEDTNQLDRSVISTHSLLSMPSCTQPIGVIYTH